MEKSTQIPLALIPAAGLGTRLHPLTKTCPKELLDVGGAPAIYAPLLEAEAAGVEDVVVILSPAKSALERWLREHGQAFSFKMTIAYQHEPRGVLDALSIGCKAFEGVAESYAVLYPDYISLPSQQGLSRLNVFRPGPRASMMGLYRVNAESLPRMGRTAYAITEHVEGPLYRIRELSAKTRRPGAIHTCFAEIRGAAQAAALADVFGEQELRDEAHLEVFNRVAGEGELFGVMMDEPLLDLGVMQGYHDGRARFKTGQAVWRRAFNARASQCDPDYG